MPDSEKRGGYVADGGDGDGLVDVAARVEDAGVDEADGLDPRPGPLRSPAPALPLQPHQPIRPHVPLWTGALEWYTGRGLPVAVVPGHLRGKVLEVREPLGKERSGGGGPGAHDAEATPAAQAAPATAHAQAVARQRQPVCAHPDRALQGGR